MFRKLGLIVLLLLVSNLLYATDIREYKGRKNEKSLADPFLFGLINGPFMPKSVFNEMGLSKRGFDNAQYRITYAIYEIYPSLNFDLIGLMEDLDRTVVVSYNVPLEEALGILKGGVGLKGWKNYNTFMIEIGYGNSKTIVNIEISKDGKFKIWESAK